MTDTTGLQQVLPLLRQPCAVLAPGAVQQANPAFAQFLGYPDPVSLQAAGLAVLLPQEEQARLAALLPGAAQPEPTGERWRFNHRDGYLAHAEVRLLACAGPALFLCVDNANLADARPALMQDKLQVLESVIDSAPFGLLVLDAELRVVYYNRPMVEQWYFPPELQNYGKVGDMVDYLRGLLADPTAWPSIEERMFRTPGFAEPIQIELKDGRVLHRLAKPLLVDGKFAGRFSIFTDVTAAVRATESQQATQRELEKSLAVLQATLDAVDNGILAVDHDGIVVACNQRFGELWGLPREALQTGLPGERLRYPLLEQVKDPERLSARVDEFYRDHQTEYFDQFALHDGRVFERYNRAQSIDGQIVGRVVSYRDITQRLRAMEALEAAQRELEESLAVLQATLEAVDNGILAVDQQGRVVAGNRLFAELWNLPGGLPPRGADAGAIREQIKPLFKQPERFEERVQEFQGDPQSSAFDTFELVDGRVIERFSQAQVVHGDIAGRVISYRDITPRIRAEQARRSSDERFSRLALALNDVFWVFNLEERRLVYLSPSAERTFGRSAEQLLAAADGWFGQVHSEDRELVGRMYEERLASRTAAQTECEYRVLHLDGTERWVRDRVSGVYQQEDGQWAMCGITDDITERKRVELERRELELQFQQTQRLEAIGTLAGGIAHDFNNILAAIIGYAELVLDGLRDEDAIESQQQVLTAAQRATDLVRQILSFSRHSKSEVHPLRVSSIVKEVMHLIRASLPSNIDVKLSLNDPDALVLAEGTQIHQILMNLCTNAGHAMEASGGRLQVSQGVQELPGAALPEGRALDPGPYLRLQVKDSGPGIPPEHMDRLFDLFFTTKEAGKGTGMGLATVQRIATELGGFVRVESAPGAGAQFDVYLPVTAQTAAGDNAGRPALPHGAERVLLVDDEATLVVMRTEGLTRLGYNVTSCFTSQEAWQRFAAAPDGFDLLVTDHMMPGLTGAELARRVLGLRPGFPVIMCSGTDSAFSKEQAQDIGMAEFLLKPVALYDLARAMRRVLEGAGRR